MDINKLVDETTNSILGGQSTPGFDVNAFVNEQTDQILGLGKPAEPEGDFVAGVKAGTNETAGLSRAAAATVQEALGFKDAAKDSMAQAEMDMQQAEVVNKRHLNSPFDIRTDEGVLPFASDAADFLQFQVGKQVPNIAMVAASALTGGLSATAALGSAGAKETLLTVGGNAISKKVAAQIAGGYAASAALETGSIRQEQADIGVSNPAVALTGGGIAGALEFLPIYNLARMVGVGPAFRATFMTNLAKSGLFAKIAGYGGLQALSEAGTEALQEVVDSTARQVVDDHYDMLGPDGRKRILEAAIVGGAVGLPFGAAGSVFVRAKKEADPDAIADELSDEMLGRNKETGTTPAGMPKFDPYDKRLTAPVQESQDSYIKSLFERLGPPGSVSGNITDTQPPAKTRLPTITVVGEQGLDTGDSHAISERNAFAEHVAEINARSVPPERRTPSQAALVKIKDRERAGATAEMLANPRVIVGPIAESRADSGIIVPGGVSDTRTDNVSLVVADTGRARPKPPKQPSLTVPAGTPVPRLQTADEVNRENVAGGGTILVKHGDFYNQSLIDQQTGALVETAPQARTLSLAGLDIDSRFGNGIDRNKLTTIEQTQLQQLEEKDLVEGLSQRETDRLSYLLDKAQGVDFNLPNAGAAALEEEVNNEFLARPIEDPTRAILSLLEGDNGDPYASRTSDTQSFPTTMEDVKATLEKIALPGGPSIVIVPHTGVLPAGPIRSAGSKPGTRALFVPDSGTVYMIANRMSDAHSIVAAYFHEVIGHYGLNKLLDAEHYKKFVDLVYRSVPIDRIRAIAKLYDLSMTNPYDRARLAEEVFAVFVERNTSSRLFERAVRILKEFIEKIFPNFKFNDYELRAIMADINRHLSAPINTNNVGLQFPGLTYASRMVDAETTPKYTTRVLDALPKKDWLDIDHVAQALKAVGAKASEMEVFREVLALPWMGRTFLASDLRAEVMKRVATLEPVTEGNQAFNTHGFERIGRVDRETMNTIEMQQTIWAENRIELHDATTSKELLAVMERMLDASTFAENTPDYNFRWNKFAEALNQIHNTPNAYSADQMRALGESFSHIWGEQIKAQMRSAYSTVGTAINFVFESPFAWPRRPCTRSRCG